MKSINTKLEKIAKQYEDTIKAYATTIFNDKVIPICLEKGLSYCTMNGFPQFYDKEGNRVEMPKKLYSIFEGCYTKEGDPLHFYFVDDFNPFNQNFSKLDIDNSRKKYENMTVNESILSCWQTLHMVG